MHTDKMKIQIFISIKVLNYQQTLIGELKML